MMSNAGMRSAGFAKRSCWWWTYTVRRSQIAKKQSGSSQPEKPIRVSAESIWSKPLSKRQRAVFDVVAKSQALGGDAHIDYSDIPSLSDKQLAQFKRAPKKLVQETGGRAFGCRCF